MNREKEKQTPLRSKTPPLLDNDERNPLSELNNGKKNRAANRNSSTSVEKDHKLKKTSSSKISKKKIRFESPINGSIPANVNLVTPLRPTSTLPPKKKKTSHSKTFSNSFNAEKSLSQHQDNYKLQVKINHLQKSISSQEKALKSLSKKIIGEKSELNELYDKFQEKIKLDGRRDANTEPSDSEALETKRQSKQKLRMSELGEEDATSNRNLGRSSVGNRKSQEEFGNLVRGSVKDEDGTNFEGKRSYKSKYEQLVKKAEESRMSEKESKELDIANRSFSKIEGKMKYKKKINDLKAYVMDIRTDYENEIADLKMQIRKLNEDNFQSKQKNYFNKSDVRSQVENVLNRRIKDFQDIICQKDLEILTKEAFYKNQIEEINSKLASLQTKMRKSEDYEEKINDLTQQLQLKSNEVQMTKKYYMDKLQTKIDDQVKQKKEWSRVYNELLSEIRTLKGEIDLLGYENRKLSLNATTISNKKWKDDSELLSSKKLLLT